MRSKAEKHIFAAYGIIEAVLLIFFVWGAPLTATVLSISATSFNFFPYKPTTRKAFAQFGFRGMMLAALSFGIVLTALSAEAFHYYGTWPTKPQRSAALLAASVTAGLIVMLRSAFVALAMILGKAGNRSTDEQPCQTINA